MDHWAAPPIEYGPGSERGKDPVPASRCRSAVGSWAYRTRVDEIVQVFEPGPGIPTPGPEGEYELDVRDVGGCRLEVDLRRVRRREPDGSWHSKLETAWLDGRRASAKHGFPQLGASVMFDDGRYDTEWRFARDEVTGTIRSRGLRRADYRGSLRGQRRR